MNLVNYKKHPVCRSPAPKTNLLINTIRLRSAVFIVVGALHFKRVELWFYSEFFLFRSSSFSLSLTMSLFPSRLSLKSIIKLINVVLWIGAYEGIPSIWKLSSSKVAYSVVWNKFTLIQSIIKYLRQFISSIFLQQQWNALFFRWIDQIRSLTHRSHKRSRF